MFQSYEDVLLSTPAKLKQIISGALLYEGTKLIVFGQPKRHKSVVAEQMAFNIASGTPWLEFSTEPKRVAYIQGEVPINLFRQRTIKMGNNQVVPMNSLFFSTSMPSPKLDREVGLKLLCAGIEKVQPDVLIIDPVYKFTSDSSESVLLRFTDNMDYLIQHYGLSLILVHHARKPGTTPTGEEINQGGSELRGPVLEQWADGIIRITGELNSYDRTLDFELRHAETIQGPINIRLDPNKLWFSRV